MATLAEDDPSDDSEDDDDDETDGFAALQSAWISNDDLDDCMSRARDASTTKGYKSVVKNFLLSVYSSWLRNKFARMF